MDMQEDNYDIDFIEKYLSGELTENEREEFEEQMNADSALAEEVALHRDVLVGLEAHFTNNLKNSLQALEIEIREDEKNQGKKNPVFRLGNQTLMAIAASFVVLLVASYLVFNAVVPSNQELFTAYYQPYPNIVSPIQRSDAAVANQGMVYYENGEYEVAIDDFTQQLASNPNNSTVLFYRGVAQLALENPKAALADLQQVIQLQDNRFSLPAQWYIALSHLNMGNQEEAKTYLRAVADSDSGYSRKSQQLLEELD